MQPQAISYVRFSTPEQSKGDSLRRQTDAALAWCAKNGVPLDTSLTLRDLGKSAYTGEHRKNPDRHALALFLKSVESGRVRPGDYLLIENLDRLSREEIVPAVHLLTGILLAGVKVVQLSPAELVLTKKSDMGHVMLAVVELSRGHSESRMKSERTVANWTRKRTLARQDGTRVTRWLPAWVEERGGKLVPIPGRALAVRRIFELAAAGYGNGLIVGQLRQEKVPAMVKSGRWTTSYVSVILTDRRAVGEYQPRDKDGRPDGDPIPNYFPAVVTEAEWGRARQAAQARERGTKRMRGSVGKHVNIFAGLLKSARDGENYMAVTRNDEGGKRQVLVNFASTQKRANCYAFPLKVFEDALLSKLAEIKPHDILNGDNGPDETLALSGEVAALDARLAELYQALESVGHVEMVVKKSKELEARRKGLAERLDLARQKSAHPLSESWGECQSLIEVLDADPNPPERRLRLRAALRRIVDSIWLLAIPLGRDRLAAVQIWFADGKRHRDYIVYHQPPKANGKARQEGKGWCAALVDDRAGLLGDLRDRANANQVERALAGAETVEAGLEQLLAARFGRVDRPKPPAEF